MEPPLLAVRETKGEACHGQTEVVDDGLLLCNSLSFIEVASDTFEVGQSHLKSDPVWMGVASVLEKILFSELNIQSLLF